MKKIRIIFTFLMCLLINNTLAITENDANQFVVDIGNQAIKILKIPVDDKEKRKKELQNLLQEKFDMPFIARIILGKEVFKILPCKEYEKKNFIGLDEKSKNAMKLFISDSRKLFQNENINITEK